MCGTYWKYHTSTRFQLLQTILGFRVVLVFLIFQNFLVSRQKPLISKQLSYSLGACFDVKILEERYRKSVLKNFGNFLESDDYFNMLNKWCPEKLLPLVREAITARLSAEKELVKKHQEEQSEW